MTEFYEEFHSALKASNDKRQDAARALVTPDSDACADCPAADCFGCTALVTDPPCQHQWRCTSCGRNEPTPTLAARCGTAETGDDDE